VFDYILFPVLTHTTGMTHFQMPLLLFKINVLCLPRRLRE